MSVYKPNYCPYCGSDKLFHNRTISLGKYVEIRVCNGCGVEFEVTPRIDGVTIFIYKNKENPELLGEDK